MFEPPIKVMIIFPPTTFDDVTGEQQDSKPYTAKAMNAVGVNEKIKKSYSTSLKEHIHWEDFSKSLSCLISMTNLRLMLRYQ